MSSCDCCEPTKMDESMKSIGFMRSVFNKKNGTPRQSSICPQSKGIIEINKSVFNNPKHSLEGIRQYSHLWIIYYFHKNTNKKCHSKVHPPRLNGEACGIFASRSPHRPNPIGLTLVKLDSVKDGSLFVSGIDILDGTPIIDIKPYIEQYDCPKHIIDDTNEDSIDNSIDENEKINKSIELEMNEAKGPPIGWVEGSVVSDVSVDFTPMSLSQLMAFHAMDNENKCSHCLKYLNGFEDAKNAIINLLRADPRSVYRRTKCVDRLYYFTIDSLHITSWFDIETNVVQVIKIKPYIKS